MDPQVVAFCPKNNTELRSHEYFKESIDSAKKIGSISLDLSYLNKFGDSLTYDFAYLADQLKDSNIEIINLPQLSINDDAMTTISAVLKHTKIKNLNIRSNKFGLNGLLALSSALKESKIEVLNLFSNRLIATEIHILADSLPLTNVTALNLGFIPLNFCNFKHLADSLASTKITDLNLRVCNLSEACIKYLSTKLSDSKIQSLNLGINEMSLESLKSLADVLEDTAITELDISCNQIDPIGATYLAEKLSKSIIQNLDIGLNQIKSEGCLAIGNIIHLTQISTLNLQMNSIGSSGITSLAANLKKSKLKCLNLHGNDLQIDGAQTLANGITDSELEYLHVNSNELSNAGIGIILDALQFTNITDFDLSFLRNSMNVANMNVVANAFKYLKLKNLNLAPPSQINITRSFFAALKIFIESNQLDEIIPIKNKMNLAIGHNFELDTLGIEDGFNVIKHFHMKKLKLDSNEARHVTWIPSIVEELIDITNPISNITTLILKGNVFEDDGAEILAENFKYLKLTRLKLDKTNIDNDGIIAIADELKNSKIRYLSLTSNRFDSVAASYLTSVVEQHPVRVYLDCKNENGFSAQDQLVIKNINYMFLKAQFLVRSVNDNSPVKYDKDTIEYFKAYEIFKNVDLLWESTCGKHKYDYNRIDSQIRSNVTKHFLKIIGIVNSDEVDSDLLPTEMIIRICSYLQLNDIQFNQQ